MKIKFTKLMLNFTKSFTKVPVGETDYYHIPFWFKDNKDGTLTPLNFDQLPNELREQILKLHNEK